jgi:hypothetical protein
MGINVTNTFEHKLIISKQYGVGSKEKNTACCLLLTAYCLLYYRLLRIEKEGY